MLERSITPEEILVFNVLNSQEIFDLSCLVTEVSERCNDISEYDKIIVENSFPVANGVSVESGSVPFYDDLMTITFDDISIPENILGLLERLKLTKLEVIYSKNNDFFTSRILDMHNNRVLRVGEATRCENLMSVLPLLEDGAVIRVPPMLLKGLYGCYNTVKQSVDNIGYHKKDGCENLIFENTSGVSILKVCPNSIKLVSSGSGVSERVMRDFYTSIRNLLLDRGEGKIDTLNITGSMSGALTRKLVFSGSYIEKVGGRVKVYVSF